MVNVLNQGDDDLVSLDYSDLLQKISQVLSNQTVFKLSGSDRLIIDIDEVANQVANLQVQSPLTSAIGVRSATIKFTPKFRETFPNLVCNIRDRLEQTLTATLGENKSLPEFVSSLTTPLASFEGNNNRLSFTFAFNQSTPSLQKQKLTLDRQTPGSASLLKLHKLTIKVHNTNQFSQQLQQGLANYIETKAESDNEVEELNNILQGMLRNDVSDFYRLQKIVDTETLGKLKKEAKIRYLEYLRDNHEIADSPAKIYLEDLIRRLRLIETYINDNKADAEYEVNYAGARINYKEVFSKSDVLDALPIIPIITRNLGESTDQNQSERQFVFGIKMKFNNPVQALSGEEVFEHNLDLIDPESKEHQEKLQNKPNFGAKVLRLFLLYFFVFACHDPNQPGYHPSNDLNYDPIGAFEKIIVILRGADEQAKRKLFKGMIRGFNDYKVSEKINALKKLLKSLIERQAVLPTRNYPIQISVRKGILEQDIDSIFNKLSFFNGVLGNNPKECLRYISIGESYIDNNALCQLPGSITIEDIRYFSSEERQEFRMKFDIENIDTLPVIWVPKQDKSREVYRQSFSNNKLIIFPYNNRRLDENEQGLNSTQAFIYRFTFSLLAYLCLHILLEATPKSLFVPMLRLHEGDRQNPALSEKFVAHLSKTLSHLLSEKHRVTSQGFRVKNLNSFKINNGLYSLYSVLPKKFRFSNPNDTPQLEKLAIIIVSSLESDAITGNRNCLNRISNLIGEVVTVTHKTKDVISLEILQTFSDNYYNDRLYRDPPILLDTVNNLYEAGYRHFVYIAKAPYTSSLHITQTDEDEGLYFMSPKLVEELRGNRHDINIYPIFFDKYYVKKLQTMKSKSFYIQDTGQLLNLAEDPCHQAIVFFNLFNGITVGKGDDRFYNGVISYSTLIGIYPGVLDDREIREGLMNDDSTLKNDILQYLTLFHFSRFEKDKDISLKLDPYQNIIGEEAFSKLSLFNHSRGEVNFNSLAFLTEVKQYLNP